MKIRVGSIILHHEVVVGCGCVTNVLRHGNSGKIWGGKFGVSWVVEEHQETSSGKTTS